MGDGAGSGANRRRFRRALSGQRCWFESGEVTLYAQMANVSEGGLFLKTLAPVQAGARAALRFQMDPHSDEIRAEAVVVWRREVPNGAPVGLGLEFVELDPGHRDRLRTFVDQGDAAD
jgi:uncharacterized protein (TIGR02266 family)